jgi:hypothetical protein
MQSEQIHPDYFRTICDKTCSLWWFPVQCKHSACPIKRSDKAPKKEVKL